MAQSLIASGASFEAAMARLAATETAHEAAQELFANGSLTSSEMLDQETDLTEARSNIVSARLKRSLASARLAHIQGAL